ncbi:hypothetical protein HPP92_021492 [Vanilla planifolia]|uniref:Uncharacterized protein n=1 Tax=Vanilla planifolia TaxID=51239 RepID=A0A835PVN8_VANPL|nr:hypothetical protein HPP92_021492 [Vanilla planifolia]
MAGAFPRWNKHTSCRFPTSVPLVFFVLSQANCSRQWPLYPDRISSSVANYFYLYDFVETVILPLVMADASVSDVY